MEASSAEQGVMLERCVDGEETVVVHLAVVAETLEIPSLSKTVELQCGSCQVFCPLEPKACCVAVLWCCPGVAVRS